MQTLTVEPTSRALWNIHREDQAQAALHSMPYGAMRRVQCRIRRNRLVLLGIVPSFYLKQLAQDRLMKCLGADLPIDNELKVCTVR